MEIIILLNTIDKIQLNMQVNILMIGSYKNKVKILCLYTPNLCKIKTSFLFWDRLKENVISVAIKAKIETKIAKNIIKFVI